MAEQNGITVKIGAETDGIEQGLKKIQKSLGNLEANAKSNASEFGTSFTKIAGAVAVGEIAVKAFSAVVDSAFNAARNVVKGFGDALDLGGRLSDLSASTGETAGNLLLLERAFDTSGAGAEKVGPAIAKMQKSIQDASEGSKEAVDSLGLMGLTAADLAGKLPNEQLKVLAIGITSIEDPTERAAAAMGIFGRSGADLLPLLTNLEGELGEARDTVGSMADIMDRRANVFDAVSDRFKIISEKVRDFAAGILDKALPAIDAITSALSRIDAAAIGQKLADAFLGGQDAMKGFQAAVDAISIGEVELAFKVFWESLKLQARQSGNAIYKYLSASLQTAADTIVDLFGPSSGTFTLMIDSFAYAGKASGVKFAQGILAMLPDINDGLLKTINLAATFLPNIAGPAALAFNAANAGLDALRGSMDGMQANLEKQKETLGTSFENFSANAKKQIGEIPKEFEQNLASANAEFFKTGEQAAVVKGLQDEVTAATAATTAERATQAAQTEGELAARQALKDQQAAADAEAKANKTAIIELETQLNAAKAAGNTELVASLEKDLERKKATEEIAKLTEDYVKTLGVTKDEAFDLATNFVNAKNAAASVKVDKTTVSEAKAEATKAAEAAKSFATWLDYIKGVDPSAPVKSLKEQTADARKEITAFGEYIGVDLKNKAFPDVARKLGIKDLGDTGSEQMQQILDYIASKRGELTGIQPIDEAGGKTSLQNIQTEIAKLGSTQQTLNLDATASIESIKSKLKENIDLAVSTGEGSKILGEIKGFVETIKGLVEKIEPKLPQHALA
jgi:hypothetical protein